MSCDLNDYEKMEYITEALSAVIYVFMRDERWDGVSIKDEAKNALEFAIELRDNRFEV